MLSIYTNFPYIYCFFTPYISTNLIKHIVYATQIDDVFGYSYASHLYVCSFNGYSYLDVILLNENIYCMCSMVLVFLYNNSLGVWGRGLIEYLVDIVTFLIDL